MTGSAIAVSSSSHEPAHSEPWLLTSKGELFAACVTGFMLLVGVVLGRMFHDPLASIPVWISLAIGMIYGGRAAWHAISHRKVDIDVLMVAGASLAAYTGHPGEGALLLFLFVLSGSLEALAAERTKREVEALHALMPTTAVAFRGGGWVEADPQSLVAGETVKIRPGERVPADAVVTRGQTQIDQSAMTGEAAPRDVINGDEVYSGTINLDDPIEASVLRPSGESSLQKILNLVLSARETREPMQRAIDRVSEPYAIGVLVASATVLLIWKLVLNRPWQDSAYVAVTFLVVCSPCALIIATPTATLAAIARAARFGVLFKGGDAVDRLAGMAAVCFDKTGTLTVGRPTLEATNAVAWSNSRELLAIGAALEGESTHPIAAAIRAGADREGVKSSTLLSVTHTTGRGMSGVLAASGGQVSVRLGSYKHVEEIVPVCLRARTQEVLTAIQREGRIGVVVARGQSPGERPDRAGEAAVMVLADVVRPGAADLVRELHEIGVGPVRMLTGDNRSTAQRVAESIGLDQFDAELLPQDKLRIVGEMKAEVAGRPNKGGLFARFLPTPGVAVIGDGVNDAPALAAADVSLAIGSIGSAAALDSADIVLMSDNLSTVPWAVRLARRTRKVVAINLTMAIGVIAVMSIATLVASIVGRPIPMAVGVLAHEGGTLLVVLNSLLLLTAKGPTISSPGTRLAHQASLQAGPVGTK